MDHVSTETYPTPTPVGAHSDVSHALPAAIERAGLAPRAAGRDAAVLHISIVATPLGPMLLGTTEDAVCLLQFTGASLLDDQLQRLAAKLKYRLSLGPCAVGRRMEKELAAYFAGTSASFSTPLQPVGTDFQQGAWQALSAIPYGETRSYGEQARMLGRPSAVRAVARANGANPIAIVVPCHRVIGADGTLTGYGGELWRKQWLLDLEGAGA